MPKGIYTRIVPTDVINQRYGRLTVISYKGKSKNYDHIYECKCDCGNVKVFRHSNLKRGLTTSCGCKHNASGPLNTQWSGHEKISGSTWALIKKGARDRNISLIITIEDAWKQYKLQDGKCALTGEILIFPKNCRDYTGNASLDRIDSSLPYQIGNIQWVIKDVNLMKRNFSQERFIIQCLKVAAHYKLTCSIK